jgi:hypothetical protein
MQPNLDNVEMTLKGVNWDNDSNNILMEILLDGREETFRLFFSRDTVMNHISYNDPKTNLEAVIKDINNLFDENHKGFRDDLKEVIYKKYFN